MSKKNASVKTKITHKKSAKKMQPKVSLLQRPEFMSLQTWQTALRKQVAQKELLVIEPKNNRQTLGDFSVRNPSTGNIYKVAFRGIESDWNYCPCLDFKTNQLGTCKHLEAVRRHIEQKSRNRPKEVVSRYTSVYLSYKGERDVRIRIGTDNRGKFTELAAHYFTKEGVLTTSGYQDFCHFLQEAEKIDENFRCYGDALQFIIEQRDAARRNDILEKKYPDNTLSDLLHTQLYPYREEYPFFALRKGKSLIADEMGLGKTIQAIGTAQLMKKELNISSVLIFCPTSLKYLWKREIEKNTDETVLVIEGNHLKRRAQYAQDEFYKIVSYHIAKNDIKILKSLYADLLIMDEMQRLKNWNTQMARAAKRVQSQYTVVLLGAPLENKIEELYAIAQYVGPYCLGSYSKFIDNCVIRSETGEVIGYKKLNEMGDLIRNILIRRRKRDVNTQLPARVDKILFVPMTTEQLFTQSSQLLGAFARTLSSPGATEKLVDSLVETDAETGKTSLKPPVSSRDTVVPVMGAIGELLGGMK